MLIQREKTDRSYLKVIDGTPVCYIIRYWSAVQSF